MIDENSDLFKDAMEKRDQMYRDLDAVIERAKVAKLPLIDMTTLVLIKSFSFCKTPEQVDIIRDQLRSIPLHLLSESVRTVVAASSLMIITEKVRFQAIAAMREQNSKPTPILHPKTVH